MQSIPRIGAFAFGTPAEALANDHIARAAERDALATNARILTQPDVQIKDERLHVEYINEQAGQPSPTLRIARWMVRCCKRDGATTLILEAAPDHQWRVNRDVHKAAEEIGLDILITVSSTPERLAAESSWYTGDSTQPRTKSRQAFMERENKLKRMPWWLYRLIAK